MEDGTALAEAAREAVEAAWASQAEAREWTERGSGDAVLLAEALRMTDAAWERAAEAAEAALVVWDVALSVAATNVGPGGLAALAAADSAWAWEAATLAALVWDSAGWDSVNVMGYSAETAREFEHLYHPWVDSAAAGQALGEWKALYAAAFAAYEAAEATRDSAAVAVYEAAQDRVLATEKDAADSAADAAWEREWDRVWDEWLGDLSRGTTTTDVVSYARDAGERARRAAGGGAFYAAVAARDAARDAAEATKDSAAVAAYESAVALMDPWGAVGPGTQVRLAALKAREVVDAVRSAAAAWAAASTPHRRAGS